MKYLFIILSVFLLSCTSSRVRLVNPPHHSGDDKKSYEGYHSKGGQALLEIFEISYGKKQDDQVTVRAFITNAYENELVIDLRETYQWSAWYRWKRYPLKTSTKSLVLKTGEKKEVSWVFRRREFGVMLIPFLVKKNADTFEVKFEYCSPWEECKTAHQVE